MKFKAPIEVESSLVDSSNSSGSAGQVLTSTGVGVDWINPTLLPAESAEKVIQTVRFGEAVSKGDPLVITGYHGSNGPAIVERADATDATKMPAYGVALEDYANNATGLMIAVGDFDDFNTSSYNVGDTLYVAVGGGMTNVKPTGTALIQNMGIVSRKNANNGSAEIVAIGRTNDVPNLPTGRLFVGTAANTSLASDVIYVDDANERVGIRTTGTPSTNLEVSSSSNLNGIDISVTTNPTQSGALFFTTNTASEGFMFRNANGTFQINSGGVPNNTSGNNRISIIGSSGNVGIGTNSPGTYKLAVAGSTAIGGDVEVTDGLGGDKVLTLNTNNGSFNIGDIDGLGDQAFISGDSSSIEISVNQSTSLYCDSNNRVGINETIPTQRLHVSGNARVTGAYYDSNNNPGTSGQILSSTVNGTDWIDGSAIPGVPAGSGTTNYLARWTPDANTLGVGVTYDNGTNVGIGTTNPTALLTLESSSFNPYPGIDIKSTNTYAGSKIRFLDSSGSEVSTIESWSNPSISYLKLNYGAITAFSSTLTLDDGFLYLSTAGSERMRITSSGNVGIGTTNPDSKLEVASTDSNTYVHIRSDSTGSTRLKMSNSTDTNSDGFQIINNGLNGQVNLLNYKATTLALWTNSTQRVAINNSGNVGIGTPSPSELLHISSLGPARLLIEADTNNVTETDNAQIILKQDGGAVVGNLGYKTDTNGIEITNQYAATDGILTFGTSGTERMRVKYTGEVGINTTSPYAKLHVASGNGSDVPTAGSATGGLLVSNTNKTYGINMGVSGSGWSFIQSQRADGDTTLYNLNLQPLGGNVGIGTTNPGTGAPAGTKLHVIGEIHSSTFVSAVNGLGVYSTSMGSGRGLSLYGGAQLYPQYGMLFATTSDLGTFGSVSGDFATYMTMSGDGNGRGWIWKAGTVNSTSGNVASISTSGQLTLASTATATNFILSSDETLKDNIKEIDTKHVDVDWKNFELKSEPGIKRAGVIAQELEIKHPEFVRTAGDGIKSVAYIDLLITKIAELEARLEKAGL